MAAHLLCDPHFTEIRSATCRQDFVHGITDTYQVGLSPEMMIGNGRTGKNCHYENSQHQTFFHVTLLLGAIPSARDPSTLVGPVLFAGPSSGAYTPIDAKSVSLMLTHKYPPKRFNLTAPSIRLTMDRSI